MLLSNGCYTLSNQCSKQSSVSEKCVTLKKNQADLKGEENEPSSRPIWIKHDPICTFLMCFHSYQIHGTKGAGLSQKLKMQQSSWKPIQGKDESVLCNQPEILELKQAVLWEIGVSARNMWKNKTTLCLFSSNWEKRQCQRQISRLSKRTQCRPTDLLWSHYPRGTVSTLKM